MITDKQLVRERFGSNFRSYDRLAHVQQQICGELAELCRTHATRRPSRALELGIGTGFLTRRLVGLYPDAQWLLNDIADCAAEYVDNYIGDVRSEYLWGDAENIDFPGDLDLVASASTIQWFDDLPAFIAKSAQATVSGGYLALTTFGKENFKEISVVTGEGLKYYSRSEIEDMVAASGYRILHSTDYIKSLLFDSPTDVLHHIKATGVNSISKTRWTKGALTSFENVYREKFAISDSRVTLTYHPIILVAEKI